MRLACADNTFRLLQPWESAVELIRLLGLEGVDVCLMGNRSHIRPEDVRADVAGAAERIRAGLGDCEQAVKGPTVTAAEPVLWSDAVREVSASLALLTP